MNRGLIMAVGFVLGLGSFAVFASGDEIAPDNPASGQTVIEPDKPDGAQETIAPLPVGRNASCRKARRIIRAQGFYQVKTVDCSGEYFDFTAWRLASFYRIRVRRSDGRIVSAEPQRLKPLWDQ